MNNLNARMGVAAVESRIEVLESQLEWQEEEMSRLMHELSKARIILAAAYRLGVENHD